MLIAEDITKEFAAMALVEEGQHEAHTATEAKAEFLASIAHEIKTPMNAVLGMSELLMQTPLDERQREFTSTIQSSGEALLRIVDDLVDFSRSDSGKLQLEDADFNLAELVAESINQFAQQAHNKGISLAVQIQPGFPESARGDRGRIRQVLMNLLSNALKFTDAGGIEVRLRTGTTDGGGDFEVPTARIEVEDTGIGIEAQRQATIFSLFEQADATTQRRFGGSGLGLAICEGLCRAMGGSIGVESEVGVGSTFWFELPLFGGPALAASDPATSELGDLALPILVADDNPVNMRVMRHMLSQLGYRVVCASNGAEAVAAAAQESFAVILMDCRMPVMDGYEAALRIRATRGASVRRSPILAITANASEEDRKRCLAAGMDDYLTKPISLTKLGEALARWIAAGSVAVSAEFDLENATERAGGDLSLVAEVAALVEEHAPKLMSELLEAIELRDWRKSEFLAHSLKGETAQISAPRAADAAARVEELARRRDEQEIIGAARDLNLELSLLVGILARLRRGASAGA